MAERTGGRAQAPKRAHGHKNWEAGYARPGTGCVDLFPLSARVARPLSGSIAETCIRIFAKGMDEGSDRMLTLLACLRIRHGG